MVGPWSFQKCLVAAVVVAKVAAVALAGAAAARRQIYCLMVVRMCCQMACSGLSRRD